jgi:hypothetical protein
MFKSHRHNIKEEVLEEERDQGEVMVITMPTSRISSSCNSNNNVSQETQQLPWMRNSRRLKADG